LTTCSLPAACLPTLARLLTGLLTTLTELRTLLAGFLTTLAGVLSALASLARWCNVLAGVRGRYIEPSLCRQQHIPSPVAATATPVPSAAEQQQKYDDYQDQLHRHGNLRSRIHASALLLRGEFLIDRYLKIETWTSN
jgi:hypothetical protein